MSDIQDCIELAIRGWEVNIHNSDERLIQVYRDDMIDWFEANSILKTKKKREGYKLRWQIFIRPVLKADLKSKEWAKLGLTLEWRF